MTDRQRSSRHRLHRFIAGMGVATLLALPFAASTASAQSAPADIVSVRQDPDLGTILIDAQGMTLYRFTKDEARTSNCYGECATAWPPLLVDAAPTGSNDVAAGLGTTARTDASQQVTYNDMPLYYWFKDASAGDTTGQNVGGVWFVVNP